MGGSPLQTYTIEADSRGGRWASPLPAALPHGDVHACPADCGCSQCCPKRSSPSESHCIDGTMNGYAFCSPLPRR